MKLDSIQSLLKCLILCYGSWWFRHCFRWISSKMVMGYFWKSTLQNANVCEFCLCVFTSWRQLRCIACWM